MTSEFNKAILIFSTLRDFSTLEVIKWLKFKKRKYYLITCFDDFNKYQIILNQEFMNNNISKVWYRKLNLDLSTLDSQGHAFDVSSINFLNTEYLYFYHATESFLSNIKSLGGGFKTMDLNKIEVLIQAKKIGLNIPNYLLCCNKTEVVEFAKQKKIITKPIFNAAPIQFLDKSVGYMYTSIINESIIEQLPETFFPTLFQNKIAKEIEIRSFFLDNKFYSMAIFSQEDDTTNVDFRRYNNSKKNRMVPFKLPKEVENMLKKLFLSLGIDTGSADIIKATNGDYVFLEINPSGQYGFVSFCCNYQLDKEVAKYLIKLNHGN
ncbi:MAG: grasp-with-spasm system ATP-grasp peptide maturase [Bacteroidota bacterium]